MTTAALILAALLSTLVYVMNGVDHGVVYYYHRAAERLRDGYLAPMMSPVLKWWDEAELLKVKGIHKSGFVLNSSLAAALFFLLLGGAVDIERQGVKVAAAALFAYTPFALGSPFRQYFINEAGGEKPRKWWKILLGLVTLGFCLWLVGGGCG